MDTLTLIVALIGGLYEMVPWRSILISIGVIFWLYASFMRAHTLGSKLDELGAKLDRLEGKLDEIDERSRGMPQSVEDRWDPPPDDSDDPTKKYANAERRLGEIIRER